MKCIRPTYLKDFQCNGSICNSRCCRGWRVVVDEDTRSKYAALDDSDDIFSKIDRLDDENIYVVKLLDDGRCPFLDDDLLCKMQKRHGENFLTAICQSYPRVTYDLGDTLEQSLTLTCPIAARLILLPSTPITFEEVDLDKPRATFDWTKRIDRSIDATINLQLKSITILQERSLSIDQRLFELCRLLDDHDQIDRRRAVDFDIERHADTMINVFDKMYDAAMDDQKKLQLKAIYITFRAEIRSRLIGAFGHVIENYIVNEYFMRCYPFAFIGDTWLNARIFVTSYMAMEFALILTAISKRGALNVDEFLNMIDAVNERIDHNRGGMAAIRNVAANVDNFDDFITLMIDTK